ncbi:MAG TPA: hypothetical protein VHP14_02290 [Anaerolineales bacterium]|nr:hypothetical protein [Anaerolineales bacterium]
MENIGSAQSEQLMVLLAQRVKDNHADLVGRYLGVLQESLFTSRALVRPSALKSVAADEVEALLNFLRQSGFSAIERGEKLHQAGFNAGAILRLSQATRQFLLHGLENHQIAPMLKIVDDYETAIIEGFVQSIDNVNKAERAQLERVLNNLHQNGGK